MIGHRKYFWVGRHTKNEFVVYRLLGKKMSSKVNIMVALNC